MMSLIASAATGVAWAWCLPNVAPHSDRGLVLLLGAIVGAIHGACIRPFKDSDSGGKAIIVTAGLITTALLYLAAMITLSGLSSGRLVKLDLPALLSLVTGTVVLTFGLTIVALPFLWPFAAINHALIWWLQTDRDTSPSV